MCARREQIIIYTASTPTSPLCHSPLQLLKTPLAHTHTHTHPHTHIGSNQQLDGCVRIFMYTRDCEVYVRDRPLSVYSGAYDRMQ